MLDVDWRNLQLTPLLTAGIAKENQTEALVDTAGNGNSFKISGNWGINLMPSSLNSLQKELPRMMPSLLIITDPLMTDEKIVSAVLDEQDLITEKDKNDDNN